MVDRIWPEDHDHSGETNQCDRHLSGHIERFTGLHGLD